MQNFYVRISKVAICIFIIYILFWGEIQKNNLIMYMSVAAATIGVVLDWRIYKLNIKTEISPFSKMIVVFGIYSFLSGLIVCQNMDFFISSIITFTAFSLVCLEINYISVREKSVMWIITMIQIAAILCALFAIFRGYETRTEGVYVTTLSSHNNPNTLGVTMVLGIFSVVFSEKKMKKYLLVNVTLVCIMLYVIILSGSRKSLVCGGLLFLLWFINFLVTEKGQTLRSIFRWIIMIILLFVVIYYITNKYYNTSSFEKIMHYTETGQGANSRKELFNAAIELWTEHPLIGIGFHQFDIVSGYGKYSHMTYSELLACTGLVGTIIFMHPLMKKWVELFRSVKTSEDSKYSHRMSLVMFSVEMVLGIGNIFMYSMGHMLIFTFLFLISMESSIINDLEEENNECTTSNTESARN